MRKKYGKLTKEQSADIILKYRQKYAKIAWKWLQKESQKLLKTEPQFSNTLKIAKYILNHYDALTLYLTHPDLPSDNNLVERLLRPEKLIQNNSKFRMSYNGRAALDIIRSIYETAKTYKIDTKKYVIDLMRHSKHVQLHPEEWTPWAWAERQKSSSHSK